MGVACLPIPPFPEPPDISPFTLGIATPSFSGDLRLCCKIAAFAIPPVPIPLGITVTSTILTALKAAVAAANAYMAAIPLECPRE